MNREEIYECWVPSTSEWSLWARPVLFAQMGDSITMHPSGDTWSSLDVSWAPGIDANVAVVVDLPGQESVQTGLALAGRGFRPVPLYNACTGQYEVIDQFQIIKLLSNGAGYLATLKLTDARPVFLLDSRRMSPAKVQPKDFDNRWKVFPQDFPSAAFLQSYGITGALLVQRGGNKPAEDLAHILRRWQDAGIAIGAVDLSGASTPSPIVVERPINYRSPWHRVLEMVGLRRNPQGGIGEVVPEPSHG
jgi:hypothetical protein